MSAGRWRLVLLALVLVLALGRTAFEQLGGSDAGANRQNTAASGELRPLGPALAQEGAPEPPPRELTDEEREVLEELRKRRSDIEAKRQRLSKTEERLQTLRDKMGEDMGRMERYRDQIQTSLEKEEQLRTEKMNHLVSVYSNMNPEKAAERIDRMERETAVKLLSGMTGKAAGRILSFVQPDKANEISQAMTKMVDEVQ